MTSVSSLDADLSLPLEPSLAPRRSRPVLEFLLAGGATPFLFLASWLVRRKVGLDAAELAVGFTMFHAAYVINDPHFAVTYLLFYKDVRRRALGDAFSRAQRLRYLLAGFVTPALLFAWALFGLATRSAPALGWLIQLMFFLVGWHYVKQGFGVMVVLAARRGVRFDRFERAAILAHCFAGWAYAWAEPADLGTEVEEKGLVYRTIAHGKSLEHATLAILLATIPVLMFVLARKWKRDGRLPLVTPLTAMLASVWTWSIFSGADPLVRYVVPALHSIQYLFMVGLLKQNEAKEREGPPWFETSVRSRLGLFAAGTLALGWILFHGAPDALDTAFDSKRFARTDLGPTPYFAALYALVNLHHYFMDSVIWRRENAETRFLR